MGTGECPCAPHQARAPHGGAWGGPSPWSPHPGRESGAQLPQQPGRRAAAVGSQAARLCCAGRWDRPGPVRTPVPCPNGHSSPATGNSQRPSGSCSCSTAVVTQPGLLPAASPLPPAQPPRPVSPQAPHPRDSSPRVQCGWVSKPPLSPASCRHRPGRQVVGLADGCGDPLAGAGRGGGRAAVPAGGAPAPRPAGVRVSAGSALRPPPLFWVVGVPTISTPRSENQGRGGSGRPEAWSDHYTSALAPIGDPCPGQLCTPSRLPGPCWAAGRQSLAQPAWPCVRRPVGTCRTAWPPRQPAAPLTR